MTCAAAYVIGRNMFGPIRAEWDSDWRGWWGEEPPYHAPVFVVTDYPRDPVEMQGGTTFHFVTGGFAAALEQARAAAGDGDVDIAGGASPGPVNASSPTCRIRASSRFRSSIRLTRPTSDTGSAARHTTDHEDWHRS